VLGELPELPGIVDFALDWELLHRLFPEQRARYVQNVSKTLRLRGQHLSLCFSEQDPQFGGSGKFREKLRRLKVNPVDREIIAVEVED